MRASRLKQDQSLLDSVTDRVKQLQQKLGPSDNRKVDDYLTSLRDVERRIQKAEEQSATEVPDVAQPAGIPDAFEQHVRLLYDLQLLAYPIRSDAGDHVHVRPRADRAGLIRRSAYRSRIIR